MRALSFVLLLAAADLATAQSADDIAFCAALGRCGSCVQSNRCVWCAGSAASASNPSTTGMCVPGTISGPVNSTICALGSGACVFASDMLQCNEVLCRPAQTLPDCLAQGPNCGYCSETPYPTNPETVAKKGSTQSFPFRTSAFDYLYAPPIRAKKGGFCAPLKADNSVDYDLLLAAQKRFRSSRLADEFKNDIGKFLDGMRCLSPVLVNTAPPNTPEAIQKARSMSQDYCGAITDAGLCSGTTYCRWCLPAPGAQDRGSCVSYYNDKQLGLTSTNLGVCGEKALFNSTLSASSRLDFLPPPALEPISLKFCSSLTSKGRYSCASASGCRWCFTTDNGGTCMNANEAKDTAKCPALPNATLAINPNTVPYCGTADLPSCDGFCHSFGTDIASCLKYPACGVCLPPADLSWNVYALGFTSVNTFFSVSNTAFKTGITYCVAVNGSVAAEPIDSPSSLYSGSISPAGYGCSGYVMRGNAPASWRPGQFIAAPSSPDQAVSIAQANDPCAKYSTLDCMIYGPGMNCSLCRDPSGKTTCMLGTRKSTTPPPGRCDGPGFKWITSDPGVLNPASYANKTTLEDLSPGICAEISKQPANCALSLASREACVFCTVNNKVVPIDKSTWTVGSTAAPTQIDCPWGTDRTKFVFANVLSGSSFSFGVAAQNCESGLIPSTARCGGITDANACIALAHCGWCLTNQRCQPTMPYSNVPSPLSFSAGSITLETCPGTSRSQGTSLSPFIGGGINAKLKPFTCEMLSFSPSSSLSSDPRYSFACGTCLNAQASNGPCVWHRTTGACRPGTANGYDYSRFAYIPESPPEAWPEVRLDIQPFDRSYKRAILAGADSASQCVNTEDVCPKYTGDPAGCLLETTDQFGSSPLCYYCISSGICAQRTTGITCPLGSSDVLTNARDQLYKAIGYCESLTKFNATLCAANFGCGAYNANGGFKCVTMNITAGRPLDPSSAPDFAKTVDPYSAPGSFTKIPLLISGNQPGNVYYTQVIGLLPGRNQGSLARNCSDCLRYLGNAYGFVWCSKTNTCIPGNSTFGPFDKAACPAGYYIGGSSSRCTSSNQYSGYGSSNTASVAPIACRNALTNYGAASQVAGAGWCGGSSFGQMLPGNNEGPVNGYCSAGWVNNVTSCDALSSASIGLSFVPVPDASFDSVLPASALSSCDRICLSRGLVISRQVSGLRFGSLTFNTTLTPLVRSTGLPGCECFPVMVPEDNFVFIGSPIFAMGTFFGRFIPPSNNLSSMASPPSTSIQIVQYPHKSGLALYAIFINGLGPFGYYAPTGCTGTVSSPYCRGSLAVEPLETESLPAADPCVAACLKQRQTLLFHTSSFYTLVPSRPVPDASASLPKCRCSPVVLGNSFECGSGYSSGRTAFPTSNSTIIIGGSADGDVAKGTIRLRSFDMMPSNIREGGFFTGKVVACYGAPGSPACPDYAMITPGYLPTDALAMGMKADPATPITFNPALVSVNGFSASVRRNKLSGSVDDCTFACLAGGLRILVDSSGVSLMPAVTLPTTDCGCPMLSGLSGSFKSGQVASGRRLQSSSSYSYSATASAQDEVTLELSMSGTSAGSVVYSVPGCSVGGPTFCGRAIAVPVDPYAPPPAEESSGLSPGVIAAIVIGSIVVIGLIAGGGFFLYQRRFGGKNKGGSSSGGAAANIRQSVSAAAANVRKSMVAVSRKSVAVSMANPMMKGAPIPSSPAATPDKAGRRATFEAQGTKL